MIAADHSLLLEMARKYIWWLTPNEAVISPQRIIAQVMNIGDYADVQNMAMRLGDESLRDAIAHAQAGQFNPKSWHYWHYRLGLAELGQVPELPIRRLACQRAFVCQGGIWACLSSQRKPKSLDLFWRW